MRKRTVAAERLCPCGASMFFEHPCDIRCRSCREEAGRKIMEESAKKTADCRRCGGTSDVRGNTSDEQVDWIPCPHCATKLSR